MEFHESKQDSAQNTVNTGLTMYKSCMMVHASKAKVGTMGNYLLINLGLHLKLWHLQYSCLYPEAWLKLYWCTTLAHSI